MLKPRKCVVFDYDEVNKEYEKLYHEEIGIMNLLRDEQGNGSYFYFDMDDFDLEDEEWNVTHYSELDVRLYHIFDKIVPSDCFEVYILVDW